MTHPPVQNGVLRGDREIVFIRLLDAPRELVWKAWTEPGRMSQWWAPRPLTMPVCRIDLRVGGAWHYLMHNDDPPIEAWGKATYDEIVPPERLVFRDAFSNEAGDAIPPFSTSTVTLEERGGKTLLTVVSTFESPAERDKVVEMGAVPGMTDALDHLEELLGSWR